MTVRPHQLTEIHVGDDPDAWAAAGFAVEDAAVSIGSTRIVLRGAGVARGMTSVAIDGVGAGTAIDGIPTHEAEGQPLPAAHPNRVRGIDHLVVTTGDCDRTTAALGAIGVAPRRVRSVPIGETVRRQTFFWLGDVILELVGPETADDDEATSLWGLALTSDDLEATAELLGPHCTAPRQAVQAGRRIATIRTRDLGISTALAVMSTHPRTVG